jgi:N-acetylmuramoyl-L-alanine amidase
MRWQVLVVLFLAAAAPLQAQPRPLVMIDAGHGGDDVGVAHEGVEEKDLVLRLAFVLASELAEAGYDVAFTRTGDHAVDWPERQRLAEAEGAALLIMLHINGDDDRTLRGAEVYSNPSSPGGAAAAQIFAETLRADGTLVVEEDKTWVFLASSAVPTVMIEAAYMTHPEEGVAVQTSEFHHRLSRILVRATDAVLRGLPQR